jgi:hypothetical protein
MPVVKIYGVVNPNIQREMLDTLEDYLQKYLKVGSRKPMNIIFIPYFVINKPENFVLVDIRCKQKQRTENMIIEFSEATLDLLAKFGLKGQVRVELSPLVYGKARL